MARVLTTRRFWYGGKELPSGVFVDMPPTDALVHARKRNVTLAKQTKATHEGTRHVIVEGTPNQPENTVHPTYQTAAVTPEAPAETVPVRARRAYRRRDMVAETATVVPPAEPE